MLEELITPEHLIGLSLALLALAYAGTESRYNPLFQAYLLFEHFRPLKPYEQEQSALLALDFCEIYLGKTKKKPKIRWVESKSSNYAQYFPSTREIVLFRTKNKMRFNLLDSVIHEYSHHMLRESCVDWDYDKIAQTYSYENHPWEVQARTLGSAYRADCLRYVLYRSGAVSKHHV
jgi:hypothetical protein